MTVYQRWFEKTFVTQTRMKIVFTFSIFHSNNPFSRHIPTYCEYCPISCFWIYVVSVDVRSGLQGIRTRNHAHILVMKKMTIIDIVQLVFFINVPKGNTLHEGLNLPGGFNLMWPNVAKCSLHLMWVVLQHSHGTKLTDRQHRYQHSCISLSVFDIHTVNCKSRRVNTEHILAPCRNILTKHLCVLRVPCCGSIKRLHFPWTLPPSNMRRQTWGCVWLAEGGDSRAGNMRADQWKPRNRFHVETMWNNTHKEAAAGAPDKRESCELWIRPCVWKN